MLKCITGSPLLEMQKNCKTFWVHQETGQFNIPFQTMARGVASWLPCRFCLATAAHVAWSFITFKERHVSPSAGSCVWLVEADASGNGLVGNALLHLLPLQPWLGDHCPPFRPSISLQDHRAPYRIRTIIPPPSQCGLFLSVEEGVLISGGVRK